MYKLQPLFNSVQETPIPDCVYRMPKIADHFFPSSELESNIPDVEVEELEKRWTMITSRLHRLQADIANIRTTTSTPPSVEPQEMPTPLTVEELAVQQDGLINRISSLMSSLSELKSRLVLLDDPQSLSSTAGLQSQQLSLLDRIKELNDEIKIISSALSSNNNNHEKLSLQQQPQCCSRNLVDIEMGNSEFQDLVIRANPSRPPHSLPLIKSQLEKLGVKVYATTHVHSAAAANTKMTDTLKNLVCSDSKHERSKAQLAITLIWTQGESEEPSLMVSPSFQSSSIQGEANIARYLARLVPALLNYEQDAGAAARMDQLLDMTDPTGPFGTQNTKKERMIALQWLEGVLVDRRELSVVDFVLYSALVNSGAEKEVGKSTQAWLSRCRSNLSVSTVNQPRAMLEDTLSRLGIAFNTVEHPAAFTVPELMQYVSSMPGLHAKNLLVKDKKSGRLYLITARHDAPVQLNAVAKTIGAKELRFADPEVLLSSLGVKQGSVTPFALMNDSGRIVTLVLDEQLWIDNNQIVNFHPLTNEATTGVTVDGFKIFLRSTGHQPVVIQL